MPINGNPVNGCKDPDTPSSYNLYKCEANGNFNPVPVGSCTTLSEDRVISAGQTLCRITPPDNMYCKDPDVPPSYNLYQCDNNVWTKINNCSTLTDPQ